MPKVSTPIEWFVYIILTEHQSLYTGITTDVERRFQEHLDVANGISGSKGAKFFRTTRPERVVLAEKFSSRAAASRREAEIKAMTPQEKRQLVQM